MAQGGKRAVAIDPRGASDATRDTAPRGLLSARFGLQLTDGRIRRIRRTSYLRASVYQVFNDLGEKECRCFELFSNLNRVRKNIAMPEGIGHEA